MIILRSLIFNLGYWLTGAFFGVVALCTFPFSPMTRYRIISLWAKGIMHWLRIACGIRYRILGAENMPTEPCIILAKHQSAWETMAFQQIFPPQVWVLKRELLRVPFFGWGLAMTSPIAIDRSAGREALKQMVAQGRDRLSQGFWVVIFPEGTRTEPGKKSKYHIGGAWLATHTGTTVLPVAHNAGEFWGKNAFLRKPGVITVSIGKPISTNGLRADALNQQVEAWIETEMDHLLP